MDYNRETIIQKLQSIKPFLQERYKLNELALFGSYVRNEQTIESDIDIMVDTDKIPFKEYCNMYYFIKEALGNVHVDMVSKNAIKPKYFERIQENMMYA